MPSHLKIINNPCDHCHAQPGRLCRTPKGRVSPTHVNRLVKANPELWPEYAS